jgi:hypothetical protein
MKLLATRAPTRILMSRLLFILVEMIYRGLMFLLFMFAWALLMKSNAYSQDFSVMGYCFGSGYVAFALSEVASSNPIIALFISFPLFRSKGYNSTF